MDAVVLEETVPVDTVNVAVVAPTATVTLPGTVALELLEDRLTTCPPSGAAALRVTVPVEDVPSVTEVGDRVTLVTWVADIAKVAERELPLKVPVIVP
jgi:hypothetical protein